MSVTVLQVGSPQRERVSFSGLDSDVGVSLVELMIALGILAVLSLGVATMTELGFQGMRSVRTGQDVQAFRKLVLDGLNEAEVCRVALFSRASPIKYNGSRTSTDSVDGSTGGGFNRIVISDPTGSANTTLAEVGRKPFPSDDYFIRRLAIEPAIGGSVPVTLPDRNNGGASTNFNRYLTRLTIVAQKSIQSIGSQTLSTWIPITIVSYAVDPPGPKGVNSIYDCATGGENYQELCESMGGSYDSTANPSCVLRGIKGAPPAANLSRVGYAFVRNGNSDGDTGLFAEGGVSDVTGSDVVTRIDGVERLRLSQSTPTSRLTVGTGTSGAAGSFLIRNYTSNGSVEHRPGDGAIEVASGNDSSSYIDFKGNGNLARDFVGRLIHNDAFGFAMHVNRSGTPAFSLTNAGRVGIGTTSPVATLDVNGDLAVGGTNVIRRDGANAYLFPWSTGYGNQTVNVGGGATTHMTVWGNLRASGTTTSTGSITTSGSITSAGPIVTSGSITTAGYVNAAHEIKAGRSGAACNASYAGAIRYSSGRMEYCNGSGAWRPLGGSTTTISGSNPNCPPGTQIKSRRWTTVSCANSGNACALYRGWSGAPPSCESCVDWEKCHICYSTTWDAVECM